MEVLEGQEDMEDEVRESILRSAQGLVDACNLYHKEKSSGAGGQMFCTCGRGSGGSAACNGLGMVRGIAQTLLAGKDLSRAEKAFLEALAW